MDKILKFLSLSLAVGVVAGCSDWLQPDPIRDITKEDFDTPVMSPEREEYYASLREWKQTPGLPQIFVWFDSWSGASNTGSESLRALPDSVTIASNWGAHGADTSKFDFSEQRKYDMDIIQRVKGTKLVVTFFSRFPGEGLPRSRFPHWYNEKGEYNYKETTAYSSDEAMVRPYIRRYAEDLYNACIEAGYDGWDWDYEPGYGMGSGIEAPFWDNAVQRKVFVEEMSYWFGPYAMDPNRDREGRPMPKRRLLMIIDGSIGDFRMGTMPVKHFDHFILQAYSGNNLATRVSNAIREITMIDREAFPSEKELVKKIILTENFESYAGSGGGFPRMSKYIHSMSTGGTQQIGGCGLYRVGFDYDKGTGKWRFLEPGITEMYKIWRNSQEAESQN